MISSQQSMEDIKNASSHGYLEVHIFDECLKVHAIRHKEEESMDWLEGSRGPVPQTERNFIRWKLRSDHFKWRYDWVPPKTVKSVRLFRYLFVGQCHWCVSENRLPLRHAPESGIRQDCLFQPSKILMGRWLRPRCFSTWRLLVVY